MVDDDGVERIVDYGHVGEIDAVDPRVLRTLMDARFVPVVSSLAGDADGNVYNVNADTVAESIAIALQAQKLIFLTGVPGVLRDRDDPATLGDVCRSGRSRRIDGQRRARRRNAPQSRACIRAATGGVERTHIIDGASPMRCC